MVNHYFTQTYENQYKHLNFEEHTVKMNFKCRTSLLKLVWKKRLMISGGTSKKSIDGMHQINTFVLVEKRQELLHGHKRAKCHHEKSEQIISHKVGKQEAARKVLKVSNTCTCCGTNTVETHMTEDVLKKKNDSHHSHRWCKHRKQ